jgi:hypothetical protein
MVLVVQEPLRLGAALAQINVVPALTADGSTASHIILSCEHAVSDGISWMIVAHEFLSGMVGESVPVAEHAWSAAFEVSYCVWRHTIQS